MGGIGTVADTGAGTTLARLLQIGLCGVGRAWFHGRVARVVYVLTGCTAVGKSELALRWAEENEAEIVSCDSLLFYRGADIGTAKPSSADQARVPHHLVDVCPVTQPMDVTDYIRLARTAIESILARGRRVLVAGGSGFYLKAFFAPVADEVAVPADLRSRIREQLARDGLPALVRELEGLNPGGLGTLDVRNPRRVARALERCVAAGRTLAELQASFAAQPAPLALGDVRLCELVRPPAELNERIGRRVADMLAAGLLDEVARLLGEGLTQNPSVAGAIGYRETIEVLSGRRDRAELEEQIVTHTRQLARRQRTWFRTQLPEHRRVEAASVRARDLFPAHV